MKVSSRTVSQREPSKRTRKPSVAALEAAVKTPSRVSRRNVNSAPPPPPVVNGAANTEQSKKRGRKPKPKEPEPIAEEPAAVVKSLRGRKPPQETPKTKPQDKPKKVQVQEKNNNVSTPPSKVAGGKKTARKEVNEEPEESIAHVVEESNAKSGETPVKSKRYRCEICSKNFLGSNDLRKHLRIHR